MDYLTILILYYTFAVKLTFSNFKSVHPALSGDEYQSEEDENLEAGYDEEEGMVFLLTCNKQMR